MTQTITAYFDTRTEAQAAIDKLAHLGISGLDAAIHDETSVGRTVSGTHEEKGFFDSIADFFMGDEDRDTYAEGVRRGGSVVTVKCADAQFDEVSDILEAEGAADLDEKASSWEADGWTRPVVTETDDYAIGSTERLNKLSGVNTTAGSTAQTAGYAPRDTGFSTGSARRDEDGTIEVVQENLRVGKRDVSHGRVRVRSYVVEEAVSEDVNLRSENVEISRRAVDRPVGAVDAFVDRTIELEETAQEAVVSKEARVVEEIDLKREVRDRTETVSDTVRHTEIAVDDERTEALRASEGLTAEERARRGL
jgi:stress response protein YsnF